MSRPRIAFCYRYGLLGGVSAQLLNRYPYLSLEYDAFMVFQTDHGIVSRFPAGVARVAPTVENMKEAIGDIKPDITVVIDSPDFLEAWRGVGGPGRLVLEVHTTTANLAYVNHREQLAGVSHIVTVSSYMEKLLASLGLSDLAPISVVPNCLDDHWTQPSSPQPIDGVPVLWVGKLDGHKRWRTAVDLIDELTREPGSRVLPMLIGGLTAPEAEMDAFTTRLATSPGLARGYWWPRVEHDRMPALYSSVAFNGGVHLCTTSNESFGMAVAESIVRGCPVVAPAVGALPEMLPAAALYEPGDWTAAREKVRRAIGDASFRDDLLATVDQVRELTAPERALAAYRAVVTAVLESPRPQLSPPPRPAAGPGAVATVAPDLATPEPGAGLEPAAVAVAAPPSDVAQPSVASDVRTDREKPRTDPTPTVSKPLGKETAAPRGGRVTVAPRAPFAVASAASVPLSPQTTWFDCELVPGETYRLRAIVEGTSDTAIDAALVRFQVAEGAPDGGRGLTMSAALGPHMYLATGPGHQRTDRIFTVVKPVNRYGLMTSDKGPATLRTLTIEKAASRRQPVSFFLSFDVEALPGRAPSDLIDSLVWGRIGGEEHGIPRICKVLEQHGLKANFMIDFASCIRDGGAGLQRIVDFVASRGHEIQMHLHSEWLTRWWGLDSLVATYLDNAPYEGCRRMLDYTIAKHMEYVGERPRLFRAGGFRVSPDFVLAAGTVGIEALSNIRDSMVVDRALGGEILDAREPFLWENGVLEIPVDLSPEPLSESFEKFSNRYEMTMARKTTERTFNLVMHSWSLMRRNEQGYQDAFDPEHENRLHQICEHVKRHGKALGYSDYMDLQHLARPTVKLAGLACAEPEVPIQAAHIEVTTCNVCDAVFAREGMTSDICPSCGSRERHRQMKQAFDHYGNVFDGRSVLACHATPTERRAFLSGTTSVVNFDVRPIGGRDLQMDIQHMDPIADESFDCVFAIHVLNHVKDDRLAVAECARVLRPGGVFVSTVPYEVDGPTVPLEDLAQTYGADALERFGVGSYRRYGLADYVALLSENFNVTSIPGLDPVTNTSSFVFLAYKQ